MKTYHHIQKPTFFNFILVLLLSMPSSLSAADDCKGLVREAEKLSKTVKDLEEAAEEAETDLQEAQAARDKAQKNLDDFENPQDPTAHGSDVEQHKATLTRALEKAEEALLDAKADYFDALQKLIDQLQALKDLLDKADIQCKKELDAAERERVRNKLKDYQDALDEIRDQHNLEERAEEPEEPENTQKKQDELVEAKLKALLEKVWKELREKYPDPEKFRSELRKKRQEIRNDWDDGFWDTPLGKLLKERLEKALQDLEDSPSNAPETEEAPQEPNEEADDAADDRAEDSYRSISPHDHSPFGLGFSFGFTDDQLKAWCAPESSSLYAVAADQVSVITATDPTIATSQTDLSSGNTIENASHIENEKLPSTKICLDEWIAKPQFGLFFNIGLGRQWSGRIGAFQQSFQASPLTVNTAMTQEDGIVYTRQTTLTGAMEIWELQAGIIRYIGKNRIRPITGIQGIYQLHQGTATLDHDQQASQEFAWKDNRWGLQAVAGLQINIFRHVDLGISGRWGQYFTSGNDGQGTGLNVQLIWHP